MNNVSRIAIVALVAALSAAGAFSATLNVLVFANTEDEGIGCIHDVVNLGAFVRDVQAATGLQLKAKVRMTLGGVAEDKLAAVKKWASVAEGWSRKDLEAEIKALSFSAEDVFLFYYSGHGGRMSDKKGRWPDMALGGDTLTDLQYPADLVSKKPVKPRLVLVLGDCCNNYMDKSVGARTKSAKSTAGLKPLFMDNKGVVISSSSEPGQFSLGGSDGGVFSNAYFKAAYNPANGSWESVLKSAQSATARDSEGKQKAQFELKGLEVVGQPAAAPVAAATPVATRPEQQASSPAASEAEAESDEDYPDDDEEEGLAEEAAAFLAVSRGKAAGRRSEGASPYPFAELTAASLEARGADLVVSLELKSLPRLLAFDAREVPADELEYEWAAYIDADGDENPDYCLSLDHYKQKAKASQGPLLEGCQAALYELSEEGGELVAELEASVERNRITLVLPDYEDWFELEEGAGVSFSAVYYLGGESYIP